MKKITFIILLTCLVSFANSQIYDTLDISAVSTDTVYYYDANTTKYNTSIGYAFWFEGTTGAGTLELLNSPVDTTAIVMANPEATISITSDTVFAVIDTKAPFSRYGWRLTKGTLTGEMKVIFERKTRK